MTKIIKAKRLLLLLSLICCLLFIVSPSLIQASWVDEDFTESLKAYKECEENDKVSMECYIKKSVQENAITVSIGVMGLEYDEEKGVGFNQEGALSMLGNLIAGMYANPPASFSYYAYDVLQNVGLAPKAYAQGIGYSGLSPIMPLWKAFRNITYMLLVIILMIIGLMIMFRMKINPQTVISIQNALPRIAVTLLLITFSYAIVGFLIDLMYLAIMLVIALYGQAGFIKPDQVALVQTRYLTEGARNLMGAVFGGGLRSVDDIVKGIFGPVNWGREAVLTTLAAVVGFAFPATWVPLLLGGAVALRHFVGGAIIGLIVSLVLLFTFLRLFGIFLTSYIQIILALIFAPFQIVFDSLPGRAGFLAWLQGLIANLIIFPATVVLFMLGMVLSARNPENLWTPPFLGGNYAYSASGFISLGIVILTPQILGAIKKAFAAKPVLPISPGMVTGPVLGMGSGAWNLAYQYLMMSSITKGMKLPSWPAKLFGGFLGRRELRPEA